MMAASALLSSLVAVSNVQAEREMRPGRIVVNHSQGNNNFRDLVVTAQEWDVYDEWVKKRETWNEWVCEYEVPDDRLSDWKDFFRTRSPSALADAVKGIGELRARTIVNSGYFRSRPRSWNAFVNEIYGIENDLGGSEDSIRGLSRDVIQKYGDENRRNLGYDNYSSIRKNVLDLYESENKSSLGYEDTWRTDPPSQPSINCHWEQRTRERWVQERTERKMRDFPARLDLSFLNSVLLRGETERIGVSFDGRNVQFEIGSALSTYTISEDSAYVYTLNGTGRKAVAPDSADFSASLVNKNGSLVLIVKDMRSEELASISTAYQLSVSFTLKQKAGRCSKDKAIGNKSLTLAAGESEINLGQAFTLESGNIFYATDIQVERLNTIYFTGVSALGKSSEANY